MAAGIFFIKWSTNSTLIWHLLVWRVGFGEEHEIWFLFWSMFFFCVLVNMFRNFFNLKTKNDFWLWRNAIENWVYPIVTKIRKYWFLWVVIYPELHIEILKPMEKELAQSDIPFLSYGQTIAMFLRWKMLFFGCFFNIVCPIELIPSPELNIEIVRPMDKDLAESDLLYWRNSQKIAFFITKQLKFFGLSSKMVSPIEQIPPPWFLEIQYATLDVLQPKKIKTSKYELQSGILNFQLHFCIVKNHLFWKIQKIPQHIYKHI